MIQRLIYSPLGSMMGRDFTPPPRPFLIKETGGSANQFPWQMPQTCVSPPYHSTPPQSTPILPLKTANYSLPAPPPHRPAQNHKLLTAPLQTIRGFLPPITLSARQSLYPSTNPESTPHIPNSYSSHLLPPVCTYCLIVMPILSTRCSFAPPH